MSSIPNSTNTHVLMLPYKEKKGEYTLRSVKHEINKLLPDGRKAQVIYRGARLGSPFYIKDKTKKEHIKIVHG